MSYPCFKTFSLIFFFTKVISASGIAINLTFPLISLFQYSCAFLRYTLSCSEISPLISFFFVRLKYLNLFANSHTTNCILNTFAFCSLDIISIFLFLYIKPMITVIHAVVLPAELYPPKTVVVPSINPFNCLDKNGKHLISFPSISSPNISNGTPFSSPSSRRSKNSSSMSISSSSRTLFEYPVPKPLNLLSYQSITLSLSIFLNNSNGIIFFPLSSIGLNKLNPSL